MMKFSTAITVLTENQPVITFDASDLPSCIYLVRFRTAAESGTRKLVVNR